MNPPSLKVLKCAVQKYSWGQKAPQSLVAQLAEAGNHVSVESGQPYAELWMGSHPNGCSLIEETGEKLDDFLATNVDYLGAKSRQHFGDRLPFLFKVLSVSNALSIQIHPNQAQALELHRTNPEVYPEANHKPEMCVAISTFFALCGFRPYREIVDFLNQIPELRILMGQNDCNHFVANPSKETWKLCFSNLMNRSINSAENAQLAQNSILARNNGNFGEKDKTMWDVFDWFRWLTCHFDKDLGCFAVFIMNIVQLEQDECMFLDAGLPHAYLYGECIECMAHSDMVIRAGITSKLCDVPNLCRLVNYTAFDPKDNLIYPSNGIYIPPPLEFGLEKITVRAGTSKNIVALPNVSICLILSGSAELTDFSGILQISKGYVFILSAGCECEVNAENEECCLFRAFVNLH